MGASVLVDDSCDGQSQPTILVIGAATLDRILYVPRYPKADTKSSCSEAVQCGGGNAANTASGIARLGVNIESPDTRTMIPNNAQHGSNVNVKVQLLTKISSDHDGEALVTELEEYGVDLSSLLFLRRPGRSPVVTVIVTKEPPFTRTCIFDPGSVGTLVPSDLLGYEEFQDTPITHIPAISSHYDGIWEGVEHFHSDTRHTEVALLLARSAREGGIPVSVDVERDRYTAEFDELIDISTIVFTNDDLMRNVVKRRIGSTVGQSSLMHDGESDTYEDIGGTISSLPFYYDVVTLHHKLLELAKTDNFHTADEKRLVVTRGDKGAVLCMKEVTTTRYSEMEPILHAQEETKMTLLDHKDGVLRISHITQERRGKSESKDVQEKSIRCIEDIYVLYVVGPPQDISICDTTGAGDAFIAGYIFCETKWRKELTDELSLTEATLFRLRFASWVAGKKIGGVGARKTLPKFYDVSNELGSDVTSIAETLKTKVIAKI